MKQLSEIVNEMDRLAKGHIRVDTAIICKKVLALLEAGKTAEARELAEAGWISIGCERSAFNGACGLPKKRKKMIVALVGLIDEAEHWLIEVLLITPPKDSLTVSWNEALEQK